MVLLMQAYGHNRARQREKLGNLLDELGELQAEVGRIKFSLFMHLFVKRMFTIIVFVLFILFILYVVFFNPTNIRPLIKIRFFTGVNSNFEIRLLAIDSS